eukprot:3933031-Rhodomonas_salina.2
MPAHPEPLASPTTLTHCVRSACGVGVRQPAGARPAAAAAHRTPSDPEEVATALACTRPLHWHKVAALAGPAALAACHVDVAPDRDRAAIAEERGLRRQVPSRSGAHEGGHDAQQRRGERVGLGRGGGDADRSRSLAVEAEAALVLRPRRIVLVPDLAREESRVGSVPERLRKVLDGVAASSSGAPGCDDDDALPYSNEPVGKLRGVRARGHATRAFTTVNPVLLIRRAARGGVDGKLGEVVGIPHSHRGDDQEPVRRPSGHLEHQREVDGRAVCIGL